jgi:DNA-binding transcriptional LysR family regulator
VSFSLAERAWTQQVEGLETGADDVAFVRDLPESGRRRALALLEEPVCLVVRADHALAGAAEVTARDLRRVAAEPFLSTREWMAPREARWGFGVRVNDEIGSPAALFAFVRARFGNGVMPLSYEPLAPDDVVFLAIAGETSRQQLAWSPGPVRPAVASLLDLARALGEQTGPG